MELKLVIKTGRSAVVEFDDGGKYYSKEEYTLLINGEEYGKTEKVVTTIYGLKPDTEYKITAVYAGKEYGPVEFMPRCRNRCSLRQSRCSPHRSRHRNLHLCRCPCRPKSCRRCLKNRPCRAGKRCPGRNPPHRHSPCRRPARNRLLRCRQRPRPRSRKPCPKNLLQS